MLAAVVGCSEPTAPVAVRDSGVQFLGTESLAAVRTVLDDATGRLMAAVDDASVRGQLSRSLITLQRNLGAGQLVAAEAAAADARGVLARAAAQDAAGRMAADLAAIDLALGVVSDEIVRTRQQAAGGAQ